MTLLEYVQNNPKNYYYVKDKNGAVLTVGFFNMFKEKFAEEYIREYEELSDKYIPFCEKILSLIETDGVEYLWQFTSMHWQDAHYIMGNWSEFILRNKAKLIEFSRKYRRAVDVEHLSTDEEFVLEWIGWFDTYLGNDIINQSLYGPALKLAEQLV